MTTMDAHAARIDPGRRASPDERFALAAAAAGSERRNRPRHLVIFATILLVASLIYLGVAVGERGRARAVVGRQTREAERLAAMAAELVKLEQQAAASATGGVGAPMSDLTSRLERFAADAGLVQPLNHRRGAGEPRGGAVLYRYPYDIRDPSLENVMTWFQKSVEGIPGLEIQSLKIRPEPNAWFVQVTFSRWERTS